MKRILFFPLITLLLYVFFFLSTRTSDLKLESGIRLLFSKDMGYTLLGKKPVSIEEWSEDYVWSSSDIEYVLKFCVKAFQESPRFIFKVILNEDGLYRIEFIHKKALKKIIFTNRDLFVAIKKRYKNYNVFLQKLKMSKESIFDILQCSPLLEGILLGYGKANSSYFCRRYELGLYLKKYPLICTLPFNPKPSLKHIFSRPKYFDRTKNFFFTHHTPKPNKNFLSLEEEWSWMQTISWDIRDQSVSTVPYYLSLPVYICRHGEDSEQIRDTYVNTRRHLADLLYNRTFKEVVLEMAKKDLKNLRNCP